MLENFRWENLHWNEIGLVFCAFSILAIYHLLLARTLRRQPLRTSIGINNEARKAWVRHVAGNRLDILAVQTLRNWTMTATFLASTSILIALGLMSYALTSENIQNFSHALNVLGSKHPELLLFKFIVLILNFFVSFFGFTMTLRSYNHAAFILNIPENAAELGDIDRISQVVNHGALYYTVGMRALYLTLPLIFWLLGPGWLLLGSIVLVSMLYRIDYHHVLKN
jgi:uncharacterized membrane protein